MCVNTDAARERSLFAANGSAHALKISRARDATVSLSQSVEYKTTRFPAPGHSWVPFLTSADPHMQHVSFTAVPLAPVH